MAATPKVASFIAKTDQIPKFQAEVTKLNQINDNEKEGFVRLLSHYLSGKAEKIEREKIKTSTSDVVLP